MSEAEPSGERASGPAEPARKEAEPSGERASKPAEPARKEAEPSGERASKPAEPARSEAQPSEDRSSGPAEPARKGESVPPRHAAHHHRRAALERVPCWVITASDTRTEESDTGGQLLASRLEEAGHPVLGREIAREDAQALGAALDAALAHPEVRAVLVTGGTGVAPRDITPEVVSERIDREIPGFGELFRQLSYAEIGSAALLSRALGGLARGRVVFALPGSRGAIRLALEELVLPELGHLAAEAVKGRPGESEA